MKGRKNTPLDRSYILLIRLILIFWEVEIEAGEIPTSNLSRY